MASKAHEKSQTTMWLEGFKAGQVALMREVMGNRDSDSPSSLVGKCLFCGKQIEAGVSGPDGPVRYLHPEAHHPSCVWLVSQ